MQIQSAGVTDVTYPFHAVYAVSLLARQQRQEEGTFRSLLAPFNSTIDEAAGGGCFRYGFKLTSERVGLSPLGYLKQS